VKTDLRLKLTLLVGVTLVATLGTWVYSRADELDAKNKLTLADLADYQAALAGKPIAKGARMTDTPRQVRFRDLWDQPDTFRGRRIVVQGRIARIFRQPAVGSFPALAEVWITSTAGNPFCLVFPQNELTDSNDERNGTNHPETQSRARNQRDTTRLGPDVGTTVHFTGTFLKMVTYAASGGNRLAPLIVGNRPPLDKPDRSQRDDVTWQREDSAEVFRMIGTGSSQSRPNRWPWLPANWAMALALAALAAGIISWKHLRTPARYHRSIRPSRLLHGDDDQPLEFISSDNDS